MLDLPLPDLPGRADGSVVWSVCVVDRDGHRLAAADPDQVCQTASVGKIFLLIEVATRLAEGRLDPDERIVIPDELRVTDSGLLYRMRDQRLTVVDAALLVGAVSDNLATNALLACCGLDAVRAVAPSLGCRHTTLLDYIRDERLPGMPWTPSYGCAAELADVMRRLGRGEIGSPAISDQVLSWLAADTDTSMVAAALLLDPLAHVEPEFEGMMLRHKTGTTSFARIDTGWLGGPGGELAYAVCANWGDGADRREPVMAAMRRVGDGLRRWIGASGTGSRR